MTNLNIYTKGKQKNRTFVVAMAIPVAIMHLVAIMAFLWQYLTLWAWSSFSMAFMAILWQSVRGNTISKTKGERNAIGLP